MNTNNLLIIGGLVAAGLAIFLSLRKGVQFLGGTGGSGESTPTVLKLTDTTTGIGGSPNSLTDAMNTRNQQGNDALATGKLAPSGIDVTDSGVASAASYPISFVREQKNVVTGGTQRIFRSIVDHHDPVSAAMGFITDGAFIERLPTGAGSTAPNVIEIGTASHSGGSVGSKRGTVDIGSAEGQAAAAAIKKIPRTTDSNKDIKTVSLGGVQIKGNFALANA